MKKELNLSTLFLVLSLISGVFYREFTKWNHYLGITQLSKTHVHLMVLGALLFLILALFVTVTNLKEQKHYQVFLKMYPISLLAMIVMFYARGIVQVLQIELSSAANAAISGIAGITHIAIAISFYYLYKALKSIHAK